MENKNWRLETLAVQAGYTPANGEPRVMPLVQSTTFKYDDAQSVADLFDRKRQGFYYSRVNNPTVYAFEQKIATLEGGVAATATSSGQTANALSVMNIAQCGEHIVATSTLYGGTVNLFVKTLKKMGITFTFVAPEASEEEIQAAIQPNTKAIFSEALANPALVVLDIEKFAKIAHANGLPLIVDNTFPTPALLRPFEFGADIVTHSTTKYIDGHATSLGGMIVEKGGFPWDNGKFPEFTEPDESYHGLVYMKHFADRPYTAKMKGQWVRDLGTNLAPFNAFLSMMGCTTLTLRMERHSANALALAQHLQAHPKVSWVNYPGLENSPEHAMAQKYLPKGCAGVLTLGVKGGVRSGETVMNSLKLAAIAVHVADARTCVLHPASMTHRQLNEEQLLAAGVSPDLIRVSVGIENIQDLIEDFDQALDKVQL